MALGMHTAQQLLYYTWHHAHWPVLLDMRRLDQLRWNVHILVGMNHRNLNVKVHGLRWVVFGVCKNVARGLLVDIGDYAFKCFWMGHYISAGQLDDVLKSMFRKVNLLRKKFVRRLVEKKVSSEIYFYCMYSKYRKQSFSVQKCEMTEHALWKICCGKFHLASPSLSLYWRTVCMYSQYMVC